LKKVDSTDEEKLLITSTPSPNKTKKQTNTSLNDEQTDFNKNLTSNINKNSKISSTIMKKERMTMQNDEKNNISKCLMKTYESIDEEEGVQQGVICCFGR